MDQVPLWMLDPRPYMSPGEVAQALGVRRGEVAEMAARRELVDHRTDGDKARYSRAEVALVYEIRAAHREQEAGA